MVIRIKKSIRKHLGARRWGAGNIKNKRGKGDRGGVGRGGRKHKMTYLRVYEKDTLKKKGFASLSKARLKEIDLHRVSEIAAASSEQKPTIELRGYKVLSDGALERAVVVRASNFSKLAEEKIRKAGGEAIKI